MQPQDLKELKQVLKELDCPRSIHEIYFFLRGVIAGTQVAGPSVWFGWLFDGNEPVFDSEEQMQKLMNHVMGWWNLIASAQHKGTPLSLKKEKFPNTAKGVANRVEAINKNTLAFMTGLDHAGTNPMEMSPDGRDALESLTEADAYCSKYLDLIERGIKPSDNDLKKTNENLDKLEEPMEDCIRRVVGSLNEARKTSVGRTATPIKSKKIARNDPCPCGSGKKYKKCCWLKVH
jgi:uncharacterized protein YecA (UPF0149 family)